MACLPMARPLVEYVAEAFASRVTVSRVTVPISNVMVPVGVVGGTFVPITVAENVTFCPTAEGLTLDVSVVVVEVATTALTATLITPGEFEASLTTLTLPRTGLPATAGAAATPTAHVPSTGTGVETEQVVVGASTA